MAAIESDYASKLTNAMDAKAKQKLQTAKDSEINQVMAEYKQNVSDFVDWKVYDSYNNSIG
ncbi:MAG: hypothetical protein WA125_01795, partial [Desulfosporosinus sp.]